VQRRLPEGYDVDTHFNPRYNPWDQRLCLVPNGDLQFVPEKIAREKVIRLGAAARILKDAATEEGAVT
jgi:cation diffusion facilitator CzcD-associated flavoprotein CzcO